MKKTKILPLLLVIVFISAGCNLSSITGSGVLGVVKTVDGGGSWAIADNIDGSGGNISNFVVTEMAFDPANRQTVYASTIDNGLWRSDNAAQTWKQVLSKITAYDFYIDPANSQNIYVSGIYSGHGKILHTSNGGASWEEIYNEASVNNAVNSITANPGNSLELYAALNTGVIIKSVDGGVNWFVIQNLQDQSLRIRFLRNSIYILLQTKGIAESTDGGLHFNPITNALNHTDFFGGDNIFSTDPSGFVRMALDDTTVGVIYLTTLNGLYKTTDDGKTWNLLNLPVSSKAQLPHAVASTQGGVVAYTSVGSTIYKTLDGGQSWQTQALPSTNIVNKILIDPQLPQISYAGLMSK